MSEHARKYDALCEKHHVVWDGSSPRFLGETLDSLRAKHAADPHLNNVPLARWDGLALSFLAYNRGTGLSLGEAVCMQKHAAEAMLLASA